MRGIFQRREHLEGRRPAPTAPGRTQCASAGTGGTTETREDLPVQAAQDVVAAAADLVAGARGRAAVPEEGKDLMVFAHPVGMGLDGHRGWMSIGFVGLWQ